MKGKDFKLNEKTIELLDGKHRIAIDFNTFEQLEIIYGDMQTAFDKFSTNDPKGVNSVKFADLKIFLCAGINACIEDPNQHKTSFEIGKLLDIRKLTDYVTTLMELISNALPNQKETDEDEPKN